MSSSPKVVSLFAGCGGSSLGYELAGCEVIYAVEWDPVAVETHSLNFPGCIMDRRDITNIPSAEIMAATGLSNGELDILDGSPPCQGFSMLGTRDLNDARNNLWAEFIRILREARPKAFIAENVRGMVIGKMKPVFAMILRELKASGYRVSCKLLRAQFYGVKSQRSRLIFIGIRDDLSAEPSHPAPTTSFISLKNIIPDVIASWGHYGHKWVSAYRPCVSIKTNGATLLFREGPREATMEECRLLMGFPPEFKFAGSSTQAIKQIGNAVPPLLMVAVAGHVKGLLKQASG